MWLLLLLVTGVNLSLEALKIYVWEAPAATVSAVSHSSDMHGGCLCLLGLFILGTPLSSLTPLFLQALLFNTFVPMVRL
jgi:hypothetical protein